MAIDVMRFITLFILEIVSNYRSVLFTTIIDLVLYLFLFFVKFLVLLLLGKQFISLLQIKNLINQLHNFFDKCYSLKVNMVYISNIRLSWNSRTSYILSPLFKNY